MNTEIKISDIQQTYGAKYVNKQYWYTLFIRKKICSISFKTFDITQNYICFILYIFAYF